MDHSSQRKGIFSIKDFSLRQKRILSVVIFLLRSPALWPFFAAHKSGHNSGFCAPNKEKMLQVLIIEKYYKKWRKYLIHFLDQ